MICDKKAFELRWLERFRVAAGLEFEIDDARQVREAPDFLIRHRGRTVGVEVTSLQLDQHRASKRYRQTAAENWLLIVADRLHSPGRFRPPEQNPLELPASAFDRTFFLCEPGPYSFLVDWNGGKCIRLPDHA